MNPASDGGRVLITGASRGIGLALARVFARHGHDLVLTARSVDELGERARELEVEHGVSARVIAGDLARPDVPETIRQELAEAGIDVDILVNNAGFGSHGPFHEQDLDREIGMIRVNIEALTRMTRLFLPGMVERGRGGVLQVASTAAFQPGPLMAVYYASKAYVLHFSEAIAEEVRRQGVTVTVLCPGPVPTGFQGSADMGEAGIATGAVPMTTADAVAEAGYRGFTAGRRIVIPGTMNKLGAFLVRFTPRGFSARVAGKLNAAE
ncbi:MAG: SDR family oxidoreductase [Gemmatimonadota bacterium]|nr:SDR family oxidoreductase [Gemmatimonadota bacterium]